MNMQAAGAYLWELRLAKGLSRIDVAAQIREQTGEGTNDTQVMRIEKGQPTSSATFTAFAVVIGADYAKLIQLAADPHATDAMGREAARAWIDMATTQDAQSERIAAANQIIEDLLQHPRKLDQLLGFGQRLREELHESQEARL
jgi:transcriptional regulator with XRE-family HTH domain